MTARLVERPWTYSVDAPCGSNDWTEEEQAALETLLEHLDETICAARSEDGVAERYGPQLAMLDAWLEDIAQTLYELDEQARGEEG